MRYYIINAKGEVIGEGESREYCELKLSDMGYDESRIEEEEIEIIAMEGNRVIDDSKWYAVLKDEDDNDWGYGSYDLETAKNMARGLGEDAYIAVIQEGSDPICIEEIREF